MAKTIKVEIITRWFKAIKPVCTVTIDSENNFYVVKIHRDKDTLIPLRFSGVIFIELFSTLEEAEFVFGEAVRILTNGNRVDNYDPYNHYDLQSYSIRYAS